MWYQSCICRIAFKEYGLFFDDWIFLWYKLSRSQPIDWLFFENFLLSWLKPGTITLDCISLKTKSGLHSIHSEFINFVWCLFDPLKDTKTASHLSEIATFLGGHIVPVSFIHITHCERAFCFSLGHITFGQLPGFLPGIAFFVWLLVNNCWQNRQGNWSNLIG